LAKAKAERLVGTSCKEADSPRKASNSSNALREQIAKAKEAARRAHAVKQVGRATPPREVPAVTEKEFCIQPDPAEIAGFDFGLDDPFNQLPKGSKSLLRRRIDGARADGRLNLAALGLNEVPDEVLTMYKYDPNDNSVAWGEVVDLTVIIAADNELEALPERMFPDVDYESTMDSDDDDGPQFGAVQNLDLHGNALRQLPVGLRRLTQLTKLNLVSKIRSITILP
jgi:Leucine-rich repeat (LRR) protein